MHKKSIRRLLVRMSASRAYDARAGCWMRVPPRERWRVRPLATRLAKTKTTVMRTKTRTRTSSSDQHPSSTVASTVRTAMRHAALRSDLAVRADRSDLSALREGSAGVRRIGFWLLNVATTVANPNRTRRLATVVIEGRSAIGTCWRRRERAVGVARGRCGLVLRADA